MPHGKLPLNEYAKKFTDPLELTHEQAREILEILTRGITAQQLTMEPNPNERFIDELGKYLMGSATPLSHTLEDLVKNAESKPDGLDRDDDELVPIESHKFLDDAVLANSYFF